MDGKLNNAAKYFEFDPVEIDKDYYSYPYDTTYAKYQSLTLSVITVLIFNIHTML
jgi:hypothetical protein